MLKDDGISEIAKKKSPTIHVRTDHHRKMLWLTNKKGFQYDVVIHNMYVISTNLKKTTKKNIQGDS